MIRLFLNNKEVELNSSVSFAINKQFEDITSPTDIKNDWSKTVEIPFSQSNNKLFGELFKVDRLIVDGDSTLMGIYFDPYKKVDFRLQWGDAIIMQGYAKNIDVVKSANGEGHYNITLNGELGKVFQEMKKITFDNSTDDRKYLIDGKQYASGIVNKELIKQCFESEQSRLDLLTNKDSGYAITDIIGFAPNNSFVEGFDYSVFEYTDYKTKEFTTELEELVDNNNQPIFTSQTGVEPNTVIGDGLLPRQVGEYRSYLQLPFIYWNKLFQMFLNKTEEVTGYSIELSNDWFNSRNPYWSKIVYMLSGFYEENKEETTFSTVATNKYFRGGYTVYQTDDTPAILGNYGSWVIKDGNDILNTKNQFFIEENKEYTFTINPLNLEIRTIYGGGENCIINPKQTFFIDLRFKHQYSNEVETIPLYAVVDDSVNTVYNGYEIIKAGDFSVENIEDSNWWVYRLNLPEVTRKYTFQIPDEYRYFDVDYTVRQIDMQNDSDNYRFMVTNEYGNSVPANQNTVFILNYNSGNDTITLEWMATTIRSKYYFTLNSLWNNKYNLFDEVLKYCKQYRIGVFCDDINKKLYFKPLSTYFSDYKILDWTDKLDMSKEYHIQPITFENKYLLFNYKDSDVNILKDYKDRYGLGYGEYKLTTDYNFNDETKELLKDVQNSIVYTPNVLPYSKLLKSELLYIIPNEIFINNSNDKNDSVDVFGNMYFNNGLKSFDTELGDVYITDDTEFQRINEIFTYIRYNSNNRIKVTKYPYLENVVGDNLLYFSIPYVNYTISKDSYSNTNGIYKNFWENYLNERYNKQNKIVTCYLRLKPYDIANFQYNNFIKIEKQLYMVNKIYDYQIDENQTTKVDLITIQDIKGYTDNKFLLDYFEVYINKGELFNENSDYIDLFKENNTKTIYISSSSDVDWAITNIHYGDYDKVSINGVDCVSGATGTISKGEEVPVTFVDNYGTASFDVTFTNKQGKSIVITVNATAANSFVVTKSNGVEAFDYETITINTPNEQSTTLYVTSTEAPVKVSIVDITKGALEDITINGVNARDIWENISEVEIPTGTNKPLTIGGASGADFTIDIELNNNRQIKTFKIVSVW